MQNALVDAGLTAKDIDYINAHGTGTPLNDSSETNALKVALGEDAYNIPISSTKSMTGHLLGAAGTIEAIISLMAIRDNFIPPTINLETPDPTCDLNYTPNKGVNAQVDVVMSNGFGFGGHNATIILGRYTANGTSN
jgi:3-oxoacyl-[acyl-carrier-protein] synthase II